MGIRNFLLSVLLLTSASFAQAAPICVAYDSDGNCTFWQDTGSGSGGVPIPTGGSCSTLVCVAYDSDGNCTQTICQ